MVTKYTLPHIVATFSHNTDADYSNFSWATSKQFYNFSCIMSIPTPLATQWEPMLLLPWHYHDPAMFTNVFH